MIIVLYLINYAANVGANVWLSDWSNDVPVNGTMDPEQRDMRLGVYTALGMTQGKLETHFFADTLQISMD